MDPSPSDDALFRLSMHDEVEIVGMSRQQVLEWASMKLHRYQMNLNALCNSTLPVNHLPVELLAKIYHHAWEVGRDSRDRIQLTHVCRYWRAIALSTSTLWSRIVFFGRICSPFLDASLRRAGDILVDISIYLCEDDPVAFADVLSQNADHFQALRFTTHNPAYMGHFLQRLNFPMCNLEILELRTVETQSVRDWEQLQFIPVDKQFPRLRSLDLSRAFVPWTSSIFSSLTRLNLNMTGMHLEPVPSLDAFLDILDACPDIQELYVRHSGPKLQRGATGYPKPSRIVQLPKLEKVTIEDDSATNVSYLLAHLSIPTSISVELSFSFPHDTEEDIEDVLDDRTISAVLPQGDRSLALISHITEIALEIVNNFSVKLVATSSDPAASLVIRLEDYIYFTADDMLHLILDELAEQFHPAPVRKLVVEGYFHVMDGDPWQTCLSHFHRLEHFQVEFKRGWVTVFEALGSSSTTSLTHALICPHLKCLVLKGHHVHDDMVCGLLQLLQDRADCGYHLEELVLRPYRKNACIEITRMDALRRLVDVVDFQAPLGIGPVA